MSQELLILLPQDLEIYSEKIPKEILFLIFSYLDKKTILFSLNGINKSFYNFCNLNSYWRESLNKFQLLITPKNKINNHFIETINFNKNFKQIYAILNHYLYCKKIENELIYKDYKNCINNIDSVKIALLGHGGSGKSTLIIQFIQEIFLNIYDPTIEDTYRKIINFNNKEIVLDIIDTAGCEEYNILKCSSIKPSDCFIYVMDIDNLKSSLETFQINLQQIYTLKEDFNIPLIICVMKIDLIKDLFELNYLKNKIIDFIDKNCIENYKILFIDGHDVGQVKSVFNTLLNIYFNFVNVYKYKKEELTKLMKELKKNNNPNDYSKIITKYLSP
ncbi:hypothetical protein ABK040_009756 [Willaertia magna]